MSLNRDLQPPYLVVVAHPDLVGHLVDEAEIVADQHQATVETLDGICQGVNGLQVQVVGGLQSGRERRRVQLQSGRERRRVQLQSGRERRRVQLS